MCGIYARLGKSVKSKFNYRPENLSARGPDDKKTIEFNNGIAIFFRLAIVGNGMQPFQFGNVILMCNGEIYNYKQLAAKYNISLQSTSDCEIIYHLYMKFGIYQAISLLDGEFAFILIDNDAQMTFFGRDKIGIKPLYISYKYDNKENDGKKEKEKEEKEEKEGKEKEKEDKEKTKTDLPHSIERIEIASLIKAMAFDRNEYVDHVIPSKIYCFDMKNRLLTITSQYHACETFDYKMIVESADKSTDPINTYQQLYLSLQEAIIQRITGADRPVGFLLSGGLDSSIVLSIALSYYERLYIRYGIEICPHVFTFGFSEDASDIIASDSLVKWLKQRYGPNSFKHHRVIESVESGLNAIKAVIWELETYDTTTIRASVPMYLISRYIRNKTDVRVILSGEGSDELFGGYLYFNYAPSDFAFVAETHKLLDKLFLYDVLRADRTTASHGLEIRPPFLDHQLINNIQRNSHLLTIQSDQKNTKPLLRNMIAAYQIKQSIELLPNNILHGKKEAFSDAVGFSWKDSIDAFAVKFLNEKQLDDPTVYNNKAYQSPYISPTTNEMKYYQYVFCKIFGLWHILTDLWLPNQTWIKTGNEPSARVLPSYNQS